MMEHKHAFKVSLERSAKSNRPATPRAGRSLPAGRQNAPARQLFFLVKELSKRKLYLFLLRTYGLLNQVKSSSYAQVMAKMVEVCQDQREKKFDSFMALKSFLKFMSTQFEKKVKIVRSDNALEFVKGLKENICIFWIALELIPLSVIENVTPHQVILKKKPVYEHLRVYGCFAMDLMNFKEVVADIRWCTAMDLELKVLDENDGCVKCFSSWKLMEEVYMKLALGYVDRGDLSYFLGLEVCRSSQRIFISQDKYTKDVLKEGGILNNKPYKLPMDPNLKLKADVGTLLTDPEVYRRAIASDLAVQLKAYCDSYWTSCSMTRRSTTGYYILLGDIPIS
nr:hypothetical protein [Tanacetum cinerariifolium]